MPETHHAECGCGALAAAASGPPARTLLCSCRACQARTGAPIGVSAYWPEARVRITGPSTAWRRDGPEGRRLENHFCPTCGTTLWWTADFAAGQIGIAGGAFADGGFLQPTEAFWTRRRPDWVAGMLDLPSDTSQGGGAYG